MIPFDILTDHHSSRDIVDSFHPEWKNGTPWVEESINIFNGPHPVANHVKEGSVLVVMADMMDAYTIHGGKEGRPMKQCGTNVFFIEVSNALQNGELYGRDIIEGEEFQVDFHCPKWAEMMPERYIQTNTEFSLDWDVYTSEIIETAMIDYENRDVLDDIILDFKGNGFKGYKPSPEQDSIRERRI